MSLVFRVSKISNKLVYFQYEMPNQSINITCHFRSLEKKITNGIKSTVKTGTSLFRANNEWHKMIRHDIATWRSQDMAFTNMMSSIYLIIQDSSRIDHLQKQSEIV